MTGSRDHGQQDRDRHEHDERPGQQRRQASGLPRRAHRGRTGRPAAAPPRSPARRRRPPRRRRSAAGSRCCRRRRGRCRRRSWRTPARGRSRRPGTPRSRPRSAPPPRRARAPPAGGSSPARHQPAAQRVGAGRRPSSSSQRSGGVRAISSVKLTFSLASVSGDQPGQVDEPAEPAVRHDRRQAERGAERVRAGVAEHRPLAEVVAQQGRRRADRWREQRRPTTGRRAPARAAARA